MAKQLKRYDLLIKEVEDPHAQENFWRLRRILEDIGSSGVAGPQGPQGSQGPVGPQGAPGAGAAVSLVAGETVSALKFVYIGPDGKVYLGNSTVFNQAEVIGVTLSSVVAGDNVMIQHYGILQDPSFTFGYSQMLFLTTGGNISTTVPVTGQRVKVGQGLNNGQIFIDIDETVVL